MPLNAREYRDEIYRIRRHPAAQMPEYALDKKESWLSLYLSLLPFVAMEYVLEANMEKMVSGLVFPLGFLLFWAFYYSHYKPGSLEKALNRSESIDVQKLPFLLLGTAIWFVKITVVKSLSWLVAVFVGVKPSLRASRPQSRPSSSRPVLHKRSAPVTPPRAAPPPLPKEVLEALAVLGLGPTRDWNLIHRRFRELAKRSHPDLNAEITAAGQRFMMYDAAYRKLTAVKVRYFYEK